MAPASEGGRYKTNADLKIGHYTRLEFCRDCELETDY